MRENYLWCDALGSGTKRRRVLHAQVEPIHMVLNRGRPKIRAAVANVNRKRESRGEAHPLLGQSLAASAVSGFAPRLGSSIARSPAAGPVNLPKSKQLEKTKGNQDD